MIIADQKGTLYLYDLPDIEFKDKINLKDFSFRLFSYDIQSLIIEKNNLYLSTTHGDIIEITYDSY